MYYEFYLDVYFARDLILYGLALRLACLICRIAGWRRILASAALLALGDALLLLLPVHKNTAACVLLELILMAAAARLCAKKGAGAWRAVYLSFCLSAFALGGCWQILAGNLGMPVWLAVPLGYGAVRLAVRGGRRILGRARFLYDVTLVRGARRAHLRGLLDSGNRLVQPYTARPVHIVDFQEIKQLLTEEEIRELAGLLELRAEERPSGKFTYIPYHSIGNSQGVLPALTLDSMSIKHGESAISTREVLIAVSKKAVSSRGEYQMILHPQILE